MSQLIITKVNLRRILFSQVFAICHDHASIACTWMVFFSSCFLSVCKPDWRQLLHFHTKQVLKDFLTLKFVIGNWTLCHMIQGEIVIVISSWPSMQFEITCVKTPWIVLHSISPITIPYSQCLSWNSLALLFNTPVTHPQVLLELEQPYMLQVFQG